LAIATDIDNQATEYVLALATLGDVTRNRNNPICIVQPKVAKQVQWCVLLVAVAGVIPINSANVNTALFSVAPIHQFLCWIFFC
jgi:hypothetical protein